MSVYCNQIFPVLKQIPELDSPILRYSFLSKAGEINAPTQRVTRTATRVSSNRQKLTIDY